MTTQNSKHVIAINMPRGKAYVADKPQWDGAWYTYDIAGARRYACKANAERVIASYGQAWAPLSARVEPAP